jgi:hypothetical protein
MAIFSNSKHKQKTLECAHDNSMELKIHYESNLILIQWLDDEDWIKLMYIQYIINSFSITIGPHVYDSWHIIKQKKILK